MWTTLDIEIKFDKPTNIRGQLSSLLKAKEAKAWAAGAFNAGTDSSDSPSQPKRISMSNSSTNDPANRFSQLKSFYKKQITETSNNNNNPFAGSDYAGVYSAPGALNRIMSLYSSGLGNLGNMKKSKGRPPIMREALTPSEGLRIASPKTEEDTIRQMIARECDWDSMVSIEQRQSQNQGTRFVDDLRPLPVLLRTKRAKRCKACKHILVKPEFKPQSTRFRIRLIALSYIPLTSVRPLHPMPVLNTGGQATAPQAINMDALDPHKPVNFLLTMKNHMFDSIKVTLATPSITPGRVRSKVTMLCPTFEVGPNSDVWDEALATTGTDPRSSRSGLDKSAEAGKVWDKGRNWTTVVMEVVPGNLSREDQMEEDEDVIEVPVFVRLEWEGENNGDEVSLRDTKKEKEGDVVKRELAYWIILGVGRIRGRSLRHA
ncbi:dynactin Arp1 p62 subunit [Ascosphaera apis ARSEF 7405]|uniref:Dynactin subunit 4 n=1 Tax=Ascosphaera apis ARSEF 7405 TaxID=392613 RepID=A0A168CDD4_9EURO|nr:dynactin Arp1 p62 subunit [Ascosphaera apis ARSEF 7405]